MRNKLFVLALVESGIVCGGGLMTWLAPENQGWFWFAGMVFCFVSAAVVAYYREITRWMYWPQFRQWTAGRRLEKAVRDNPGDGMAVARLIMKAPTIARVEALYADFQSSSLSDFG